MTDQPIELRLENGVVLRTADAHTAAVLTALDVVVAHLGRVLDSSARVLELVRQQDARLTAIEGRLLAIDSVVRTKPLPIAELQANGTPEPPRPQPVKSISDVAMLDVYLAGTPGELTYAGLAQRFGIRAVGNVGTRLEKAAWATGRYAELRAHIQKAKARRHAGPTS
jgi:hypothetical protein